MNKKLIKVFSVIMLTIIMISYSLNVFAFNPKNVKIDTSPGQGDITSIGGKIAGALQVVGSVLAIIILVVLGIKYMMGSPEEKAEYKKTMMPYVIGAVLIFAASNIAGVVYNIATGIGTGGK